MGKQVLTIDLYYFCKVPSNARQALNMKKSFNEMKSREIQAPQLTKRDPDKYSCWPEVSRLSGCVAYLGRSLLPSPLDRGLQVRRSSPQRRRGSPRFDKGCRTLWNGKKGALGCDDICLENIFFNQNKTAPGIFRTRELVDSYRGPGLGSKRRSLVVCHTADMRKAPLIFFFFGTNSRSESRVRECVRGVVCAVVRDWRSWSNEMGTRETRSSQKAIALLL
ncbi:hypothetical protein F4677DRAFT_290272 [Hypoxylon crocopeplum]|nr:hypothetical protein F4677DRAFT_290272 [Hypoxylon crocopeplum]